MVNEDLIGNIGSLFWIFLMFAMLMPLFKQKMLDVARLNLIRSMEKKRKSRIITLIHRQEAMAFLGFPIFKYIDIEDSEQVLRAIRLTPDDMPIDLILHTPGGLVLAAEQIALALRKHNAPVRVFVPHYAMSGGTLLALAADEVIMDENAVLGPVDPQLGKYPAASILTVIDEKDKNEIDDETLILADVSRKALKQVHDFVRDLILDRVGEARAEEIADALTTGKWTHDYPITLEHAKELGIPVRDELPEEVYALMELYPQPPGRRPSVEYVPLPYRDGSKPGKGGAS
ncbi:MAG: SDH family Clp fold serine proteinase [Candidatus Syntropharchaeales archaeon]